MRKGRNFGLSVKILDRKQPYPTSLLELAAMSWSVFID